MTKSLIEVAENEDAAAPGFDGAGVFSSWADLDKSLSREQVDPFEVTFAAAAAGLDTLDAVDDPLGALISAGIGWLIEHLWFLHEPLDALAGDPTQITAQAKTWNNVAEELRRVAAEHRAGAMTIPGWEGDAREAYGRTVQEYTAALDSTADDAQRLSGLILTTGAGVGTVRSLIRDAIADFVTLVVEYFVVSAALALLTAGGSVGAFVTSVVVKAYHLATDIAQRISSLLDALHTAGGAAREISDAMRTTAATVRVGAHEGRAAARAISDAAEEAGLDKVFETGKQLAGAGQEQRGWASEPAPAP